MRPKQVNLGRERAEREKLKQRLSKIADIIAAVAARCADVDVPVPPTLMTQAELSEIYKLAIGPKPRRPRP